MNPYSFWSYEVCNRLVASEGESSTQTATKVLISGGVAGVVTWASVFPLDVVKTRVQTQAALLPTMASAQQILPPPRVEIERSALLDPQAGRPAVGASTAPRKIGAIEVARNAYQAEGFGVFFRGLGVCSLRAFVVNAVQWAVYEWIMRRLN